MRLSAQLRQGRKRWLLLAAMIGVGVIWWLKPTPELRPAVTIVPADYVIPAKQPIPDRWIPRNWGWLWKLRYAVLGTPANVQLEMEIYHFRDQQSLKLALIQWPELMSSNGVRAWVLPSQQIKTLGQRAEFASAHRQGARIGTTEGVLSTLTTQSPAIGGLSFRGATAIRCAVERYATGIELTTAIASSEVVTNAHWRAPDPGEPVTLETNLAVAVRLQIPAGYSVFLCATNQTYPHWNGAGVLIHWRNEAPRRTIGSTMRSAK